LVLSFEILINEIIDAQQINRNQMKFGRDNLCKVSTTNGKEMWGVRIVAKQIYR
jgi:hypothetical protein